jgi:hypothetical protein
MTYGFGMAKVQPVLILIDGDTARVRRLTSALTLADVVVIVATSPYEAVERSLRAQVPPLAVILGQLPPGQGASDMMLTRLFQRLAQQRGGPVPVVTLPELARGPVPRIPPGLVAIANLPSSETSAVLSGLRVLLPELRMDTHPAERSRVLDVLPGLGLEPRVAVKLRSRNSHFRQVLTTAQAMVGAERWPTIITDAGLGQYRLPRDFPPDDDEYAIPAEYLSCLNRAMELVATGDPAVYLRRWGDAASQASLDKRNSSMVTQQAIKLLSESRIISLTLNAYTRELDEIRGEELHRWVQLPDGCYWLAHDSNLYAYGRARRTQPNCHVWLGSLDATLRLVHLQDSWNVREVECACQTLTGHCLFQLEPR